MKIEFKWERISLGTFRAKVFGGWIVTCVEHSESDESLVFIPDPEHKWQIK